MSTRSACIVLSVSLLAATASAQDAPQADAKPAPAVVRKDPRGVTGVSPFWEHVKKGDSAVLARDFDAAFTAYRAAVAVNPESALAHHRLAQAHAAKGDLKEAEAAYATALRFAGSDPDMKAKLLFCLADLRERQRALDEATQRWSDYEAFAKAQPKAKAFPASAAERKKRGEEWKKLTADSAEVKTRIDQRLKEAEAAAKKSAK